MLNCSPNDPPFIRITIITQFHDQEYFEECLSGIDIFWRLEQQQNQNESLFWYLLKLRSVQMHKLKEKIQNWYGKIRQKFGLRKKQQPKNYSSRTN